MPPVRRAALPCLLLCLWASRTQGAVCNVTGVWMSAMGSILKLAVSPDAELGGNYMTSVETMKGAAGNQRQSRLSGLLNRGAQPTFAFSVVWEGGSSSSWVGQCLVLGDGSQVLKTLWMLRSAAQGPEDDWKSTRIGEDTFFHLPAEE